MLGNNFVYKKSKSGAVAPLLSVSLSVCLGRLYFFAFVFFVVLVVLVVLVVSGIVCVIIVGAGGIRVFLCYVFSGFTSGYFPAFHCLGLFFSGDFRRFCFYSLIIVLDWLVLCVHAASFFI